MADSPTPDTIPTRRLSRDRNLVGASAGNGQGVGGELLSQVSLDVVSSLDLRTVCMAVRFSLASMLHISTRGLVANRHLNITRNVAEGSVVVLFVCVSNRARVATVLPLVVTRSI